MLISKKTLDEIGLTVVMTEGGDLFIKAGERMMTDRRRETIRKIMDSNRSEEAKFDKVEHLAYDWVKDGIISAICKS